MLRNQSARLCVLDNPKKAPCMNRTKLFIVSAANAFGKALLLILIAGSDWWVNADTPLRLVLDVEPVVDTMTAGDSATFDGIVVDNMAIIHHEFDTCIHWSILPADTKSKLSATAGSQTAYYPVEAFQRNIVIATFTDPTYPNMVLAHTDTIYVKPGMGYREFIEPYPVGGLPSLSAPMDSIVLSLPNDTLREIAAVFRDKYGNFLGFDSSVTWQELNDSGIVGVQTPDAPYICRIAARKPGVTYVVCRRAGLTIGTVKVIVRPGSPAPNPDIVKVRVINALTDEPVDSVVLTLGQNITLQLQGMLYPDSVTWVDIYGAWMFDPHIPSMDQLPLNYSFLTFNATDRGLWTLSIVTPFARSTATLAPIKIKVIPTSGVRGRISSMAVKTDPVMLEYFNLRGQKLPLYGIRRLDGIVLERIVETNGHAVVKKALSPQVKQPDR